MPSGPENLPRASSIMPIAAGIAFGTLFLVWLDRLRRSTRMQG